MAKKFKIGDKVDAGVFGKGKISFMTGSMPEGAKSRSQWRYTKAKITRKDGSRSVFINLSNLKKR